MKKGSGQTETGSKLRPAITVCLYYTYKQYSIFEYNIQIDQFQGKPLLSLTSRIQ